MERKVLTRTTELSIYDLVGSVLDVSEKLLKIGVDHKEEYPDDFDLQFDVWVSEYYGEPECNFNLLSSYFESDEEMEKRLAVEKDRAEKEAERELEQLRRLKEKYEEK